MENYDIKSLREWAPLTEILEKIPAKVQKGIFSADLNVTCIDVVPKFVALGTDAGIVFWYNRFSGDVQKLRAEVTSPITYVKIVSSVEYMVAAGCTNGQVSVFQIQKELPDLKLVAPLTKVKPIERYTIRDLHKCPVTCCEWSKNGMKLFSGDKQGVIVLTEFDYQAHLSKSVEILNEAYEIVQLTVNQSYLIVSTIYRSIICKREQYDNRWRVTQIGKKDRKIISNFGATFLEVNCTSSTRTPSIICARPGLRFWISDCSGNVQQTLLFKDAIATKPLWDIPLLNPARKPYKVLSNFGLVLMYTKNFVVTHDGSILYILNLEKLQIEAIARGFRNIFDVAICGKEIFILEGARSLIRISISPEPPNMCSKVIFNPLLPPPLPLIPNTPVEFETEDEAIINAEECFELPPIEHIDLDVPIIANLDSPTTQKNKAIIEQNKRIEVFDKINDMEFEESILFKSGIARKHKKPGKKGTQKITLQSQHNGIVEIGQAVAEVHDKDEISSNGNKDKDGREATGSSSDNKENEICTESNGINSNENEDKLELTTRPLLMDASYCRESIVISHPTETPKTPETDSINILSKKSASSECFLTDSKIAQFNNLKKSQSEQNNLQNLQYPLDYPITPSCDDSKGATTSDPFSTECNVKGSPKSSSSQGQNLSEELKNAMAQSINTDSCSSSNFLKNFDCDVKMSKSLQFVHYQPEESTSKGSMIPTTVVNNKVSNNNNTKGTKAIPVPNYVKIPTLWNVKIEKPEESEHSKSHSSSDWELL